MNQECKYFKLVLFLFGAMCLSTCSDNVESKGGVNVYRESGVYELKPSAYSMSIVVNGGVSHVIIKNSANEVVSISREASTVHKWSVFWDAEHLRLWFYSSDIGITMWNLSETEIAGIGVTPRNHQDYVPLMPSALYQQLPKSLIEFWSEYKNE
jgi:hypothetical protein